MLDWAPTLMVVALATLTLLNVALDRVDTTDLMRPPAPAPEGLGWIRGADVGPFLKDRVAFRTDLRAVQGRLLWLTGDGNEDVVRGEENWVFLADSLVATEGPNWLPRRPARAVAKVANRVEATGRRALVLPAPNKASVYPQFLSRAARRQQDLNDGRLARVRRLARERSGEAFVDVFDDLRRMAERDGVAGAPLDDLYYPTDTHWNVRGAAVAAAKLLEQLGAEWEEDALGLIEVEGRLDLVSLLGLPGRGPRLIAEVKREGVQSELVRRGSAWAHYRSRSEAAPLLGNLVVVHDSFGDAFRMLLPAYFENTTFVLLEVDVTEDLGVLLDEADIVVLVTVERTFVRLSGAYPAPLWPQTREIIHRLESAPRHVEAPGRPQSEGAAN